MKSVAIWALLVVCAPVLDADETFKSDPARSSLQFLFRQAGAVSQGVFTKTATELRFDPTNLAASWLTVNVDVTSLDTKDKDRDDLLRGSDLFDVAKYPAASFRSTKLQRLKNGSYEAFGKLTIRGVTRDIRLPLTIQARRQAALTTLALRGAAIIRRLDYAIGQGDWKSTQWVDDNVTVKFDILLTTNMAPALAE